MFDLIRWDFEICFWLVLAGWTPGVGGVQLEKLPAPHQHEAVGLQLRSQSLDRHHALRDLPRRRAAYEQRRGVAAGQRHIPQRLPWRRAGFPRFKPIVPFEPPPLIEARLPFLW